MPEVLVSDVEKPCVGGTADIVDENVDAAETLHRCVDDALAVRTAHRIGDERQPLTARGLDICDGVFDIRLRTRSADDRRAGLRQDARDALADAFPSAGDDCDLAVQLELLQRHTSSSRSAVT